MMSGSPCSSPPFRVNPHGAPPFSCTWMCWKETSCSTVSIVTSVPSAPSDRHAVTIQPHHDNGRVRAWGDRRWAGQWWALRGLLAEEALETEGDDLSDRQNGQLRQRFAPTDQWNCIRGRIFIDPLNCPLCDCLGKLRKVVRYQLLGHSLTQNSDNLYENCAGGKPSSGLSSKASANWNVTQSWGFLYKQLQRPLNDQTSTDRNWVKVVNNNLLREP